MHQCTSGSSLVESFYRSQAIVTPTALGMTRAGIFIQRIIMKCVLYMSKFNSCTIYYGDSISYVSSFSFSTFNVAHPC